MALKGFLLNAPRGLRTTMMSLRVSPAEHEAIKKAAKAVGTSMTQLMVRAALHVVEQPAKKLKAAKKRQVTRLEELGMDDDILY